MFDMHGSVLSYPRDLLRRLILCLVNKPANFHNLIQAFGSEYITDVAQGAAENPRDAFDLDHMAAVTRQDVLMAVGIVPVEFAAGIAAVKIPGIINSRLVMNQQFGPDSVNVNITGVVKHIGGITARRPHIDFQGHIPVGRRLEEFVAGISRNE
jgi:hypothetical protein